MDFMASAVRAVIFGQARSATSLRSAIHEPPNGGDVMGAGRARVAGQPATPPAVMPPVGIELDASMRENGPARAFIMVMPPHAAASAGKNLSVAAIQIEGAVHFRGSHNAGKEGQFQRMRFEQDGFVEAGGNAELRASVDGLTRLVGGENGTGADAHIGQLAADEGDGLGGGGGAESDFDDVQSAGEQGLSERHGVIRVVNDGDADEAGFEKGGRIGGGG